MNDVEIVLARLRQGAADPSDLLRALADGTLWVPLAADPVTQLPVMMDGDQAYVAAYTSAEQFERSAAGRPHMRVSGRQLAEALPGHVGLAINPGGDLGVPILPAGVLAMRDNKTIVRPGTGIRLGTPAEEPVELLDELRRIFAGVPAVVEARRALAQVGEQQPTLLIGVLADEGVATWQADVLAAVDEALRTKQPPIAVDTVFLEEGDAITGWFTGNTEPFYRR